MRARTALVLVLSLICIGLLLTRCPANRDGMSGQLAQAMEETTAAARSGALALDLWTQQRSTMQLTSVQLSDARDDVLRAYKGIADLEADDVADLQRQRLLTDAMTAIIGQLNAARGLIRTIITQPSAEQARDDLLAAADGLESRYR